MKIQVSEPFVGPESFYGQSLALWNVSLIDYNIATIENDLLHVATWRGNQPQGPLRLRIEYPLPQSIEEFKNQIELLKNDILDQLFATGSEYITYRWYKGLEYYKEHATAEFQIMKDLPGFSMPPHIDNGHIMFQMLINLTHNDSGTAFHNPSSFKTATSTSTPVYVGAGEQGKGVIFMNSANSAHSIDYITKDRYILHFTIGFND
jgi:hypothetical protein